MIMKKLLFSLMTELHPKSWTQDWRCSFFVSKLTREKQIEIENKILTENNIKYFTKIKNKSKIFYYKLIGKFIEQELKNIKI